MNMKLCMHAFVITILNNILQRSEIMGY